MKTFTPEYEVKNNILILKYKTQYELMYSLARFQEFYENKIFQGKNFSRSELQLLYPDYYISWNGCNFPCYIIDEITCLDRHESIIRDLQNITLCTYIIGVHENKMEALEHEMAHALYFNNSGYCYLINKCLSSYKSEIVPIKNKLKEMGYHNDVIIDEVQAYIISGLEKLNLKLRPSPLYKKLKEIYKKYTC